MPDIFSLGNIQMSAKSSDIFNIIITIITKIPNQIIHISYIFNNCLKIWKVYITQRMTKQCNLFQIIQRLKKAQVMIYYVIRMFYVLRIIIFQTLLNMIYSIISYWIFQFPFSYPLKRKRDRPTYHWQNIYPPYPSDSGDISDDFYVYEPTLQKRLHYPLHYALKPKSQTSAFYRREYKEYVSEILYSVSRNNV